jgi:hypothetical protein
MPPHPPLDGSLEDELTRRAQRRRRPHAPTSAAGGRHALQPREEDRSTFHEDRDTVGAVAASLTFDRII